MSCCRITLHIREPAPIPVHVAGPGQITMHVTEGGGAPARTQSKAAIPSQEAQIITPDEGYLLDSVTVAPIPSNYGLITYNGGILTVS